MSVPSEFKKIIVDMTRDILISFPEQEANLQKDLKNLLFETEPEQLEQSLNFVFVHCKTFYAPRFFDILYQNNDIFEKETEEQLYFLPGIDFKQIWYDQISEKTRETIWKYLQLVLFTVVSGVTDENTFGETAKLFETVNEAEFKTKLEETIAQMQTLFTGTNKKTDANAADAGAGAAGAGDDAAGAADADADSDNSFGKSGINLEDLPNPSDIHERVSGMMNGKLGKLAREIAEETAAELNINTENVSSIGDVFKGLMQNPSKLMGLVKNVGAKLDSKLKSGDMKESELLAEASELMKKMKDMPGMGDLQGMLSKMGMNTGGGGSAKVNVNAMQNNLDQKLKGAKNRERLLKKLAENNARREAELLKNTQLQAQPMFSLTPAAAPASAALAPASAAPASAALAPAENLVFSTGETVERSSREQMTENKKNKKKIKKE